MYGSHSLSLSQEIRLICCKEDPSHSTMLGKPLFNLRVLHSVHVHVCAHTCTHTNTHKPALHVHGPIPMSYTFLSFEAQIRQKISFYMNIANVYRANALEAVLLGESGV